MADSTSDLFSKILTERKPKMGRPKISEQKLRCMRVNCSVKTTHLLDSIKGKHPLIKSRNDALEYIIDDWFKRQLDQEID